MPIHQYIVKIRVDIDTDSEDIMPESKVVEITDKCLARCRHYSFEEDYAFDAETIEAEYIDD